MTVELLLNGRILHRGRFEECNLDEADHLEHVDPRTAESMIKSGQARMCMHCMAADVPTLNTRGDAP